MAFSISSEANYQDLKAVLKELAINQVALEENNGPESNGELFENILEIQDSILNKFGLPITSNNETFLIFNNIPTDFEINEKIKLLNQTATDYLLSNVKTDIQILRDAKELKQDAFIVLPELKIPTHAYTIFVYDEILLNEKDSIENVLIDLRLVNKPEILNALGRLIQGDNEDAAKASEYLKNYSIRYIQQFIMLSSNLLSDDDY